MSTVIRLLKIAGQPIHLHESAELRQRYRRIMAKDVGRLGDGSLQIQNGWAGAVKLSTEIQGTGPVPAGLWAFDFGSPLLLSCVEPWAIDVAAGTLSVDLPAGRRTDAGSLPFARAFKGTRLVEPLTVTMTVNTASWSAVLGATGYQVICFPEITASINPPDVEMASRGNRYGWSMSAEEI